jgi:hypothetical protein
MERSSVRLGPYALIVFVTLSVAAPTSGQISYLPGPDFPQSVPTDGVASADLNRDGNADAVTVIFASGRLRVFLGNGDGTFDLRRETVVASGPGSVAAGDFDADGAVDVVTANWRDGSLGLFLGNGAGDFAPPLYFPGGAITSTVDVADLNRDGFDDVVVTDPAGPGLLVYRGVSGGLLASPGLPVAGAIAVAIADFDVDGFPDIAVLANGLLLTFVGDGAWGWQPRTTLPVVAAYDIVTGDFDADGLSDVAWAYYYRFYAAHVRFGDGTGGLADDRAAVQGAEFRYRLVALGPDPDGQTDLAIYRGETGFFTRPAGRADGFARSFLCCNRGDAAAADVNGDGYADLIKGEGVHLNRSHRSREGNVHSAAGPPVDVLFVNGSRGVGRARRIELVTGDPFEIYLVPPPSAPPLGPVRYALYAWRGEPRESPCNFYGLPFGLGLSAMPTPLTAGSESPQPTMIWNNLLGTEGQLGAPMRASAPAPASVVERRRGVRVSGTFFVQGIIRDTAAPNGRAAVTNGVLIVSPRRRSPHSDAAARGRLGSAAA